MLKFQKREELVLNSLLNYFLESSVAIAVLMIFYQLFLRRLTTYKLNRFFLLFVMVFGSLLPLLNIEFSPDSESVILPLANLQVFTVYAFGAIPAETENGFSIYTLFIASLALGTVILLFRFFWRISPFFKLVNNKKSKKYKGFNLVFLYDEGSPFSFFKWIFWPKMKGLSETETQIALQHELVHVKQYHSLDIILFELLLALNWFNPFFWLIGNCLREQHEFLADRGAVTKDVSKQNYMQILAYMSTGGIDYKPIFNNFNKSYLKKRIIMLNKNTNVKKSMGRVLFVLPILAILLFTFACNNADSKSSPIVEKSNKKVETKAEKQKVEKRVKEEAVQKTEIDSEDKVFQVVEVMPSFPGGDKARIKYLSGAVEYPKEAKEKGVQGTVYVGFVVEKDGSVSDVKIMRGLGSGCDEAAMSAIEKMPKWNPGTQRGKAVRVGYTIPISFKLSGNTEKSASKKDTKAN